jgi:uncharacterized membrane protein
LRIKLGSGLLPLNIVVVLLIVISILVPISYLRIIIGLLYVLFFPGYVLTLTLFPRNGGISGIERVALSFGLSIAAVPVIGLILSATPWGITVESILYSTAAFIFVVSIIALVRRKRLQEKDRFNCEFQLSLLHRGDSAWDKALSVVLLVVVLGAIGTLCYVIIAPRSGEKFTEFYVRATNGEETNYPQELYLGETYDVTIVIINHEQQEMPYRVEIQSAGTVIGELGPVVLKNEQAWEQEFGFTPLSSGDNQKVEFFLYKQGQTEIYRTLHLRFDVK